MSFYSQLDAILTDLLGAFTVWLCLHDGLLEMLDEGVETVLHYTVYTIAVRC